MSAQPYAIVLAGVVTNIVQWDGIAPYNVSPASAVATLGNPNAQIGGTYSGGVFTAAAPGTPAQGVMFVQTPLTGFNLQIPNPPQPQNKLYVLLEPAGTLATGTLVLPVAPADGADLYLESTQTITTLTVQASPGQSTINIPGSFTLNAGASQHITWSAQLNSWFRL